MLSWAERSCCPPQSRRTARATRSCCEDLLTSFSLFLTFFDIRRLQLCVRKTMLRSSKFFLCPCQDSKRQTLSVAAVQPNHFVQMDEDLWMAKNWGTWTETLARLKRKEVGNRSVRTHFAKRVYRVYSWLNHIKSVVSLCEIIIRIYQDQIDSRWSSKVVLSNPAGSPVRSHSDIMWHSWYFLIIFVLFCFWYETSWKSSNKPGLCRHQTTGLAVLVPEVGSTWCLCESGACGPTFTFPEITTGPVFHRLQFFLLRFAIFVIWTLLPLLRIHCDLCVRPHWAWSLPWVGPQWQRSQHAETLSDRTVR